MPAGPRSWRSRWAEEYGAPEENPEFWNGVSSNSYLADISGPVQLHHGNVDEEVPWEFSQTLFDQLTAAGKDIQVVAVATFQDALDFLGSLELVAGGVASS